MAKLALRMLNLDTGNFEPADWPAEWSPTRDQITARLRLDQAARRSMQCAQPN